MKLYPYKQGSKSAKALAEALGIKRIKHDGPPLITHPGDVVINWGASKIDRKVTCPDFLVLNYPDDIANAANKLNTFHILDIKEVSIPQWTEDRYVALNWLIAGDTVVARTVLNGHSGQGITIVDKVDDFVEAPLYTKYVKKAQEYRIHVFRGEAFFVQRKARKLDVPDDQVNWKVRNLAGGFIFANDGVEVDDVARREACAAVAALHLDFGAVDIILGTDGVYYVLEVNTACGLEGKTLQAYVEQFNKFR